MKSPHKYTKEEREFFKKYIPGHTVKEIRLEFIRIFNWEIGINQIMAYMKNHKIKNDLNGRFQKGHIPVNKGKKLTKELYEKSKHTMFQKGNIPVNYKDIGSERITKDGYIMIKVAEPSSWQLKHKVIWEKEKGKIPKGMAVVFRDNNKQNCIIENLILVHRRELLEMNKKGYCKYTQEYKDVAVNLAKLSILQRDAKKRTERNKDDVR